MLRRTSRLSRFLKGVRGWQSGLASLVGFSGIIITLIVQDRFSREQDARRQYFSRNTLRVGLASELLSFENLYCGVLAHSPDSGTVRTYIPAPESFRFYSTNITQLGTLTPLELVALNAAQSNIQLGFQHVRYAALRDDEALRRNQIYQGIIAVPVTELQEVRATIRGMVASAHAASETLIGELSATGFGADIAMLQALLTLPASNPRCVARP